MRFSLLVATALTMLAPFAAEAQTIQQRYEAAEAKLTAKDAAGAFADLERLETELAARPKPPKQSLALVRARKGEALAALARPDEAIVAYRLALAGGALDGEAVAGERDFALLGLAKLEESTLDHASAALSYRRLADVSRDPTLPVFALSSAARTTMFVDGDAALALADRAVALMQSLPDFPKGDQAIVLGTRGRVLLNNGREREAFDLLERAVSLRGGMTTRVDLWDIALRSDAALAALRLGREEDARRYLAYSGAGTTKTQLGPAAESELPDCADLDGFTPQDSVIVQFAILEDGRVAGAQPVLASKPGSAAIEFARHAGRWTWNPETMKEIDPFFRIATRLELRCTNSRSRPPLTEELETAFAGWLTAKGAPPLETEGRSDASLVSQHRARLDAARKSGSAPAIIGGLWALSENAATPVEQSTAMTREALALLPTDAPPAVRALFKMEEASLRAREARGIRGYSIRYAEAMRALLAEPAVAADPRLRAIVRLALARSAGEARWKDVERQALTQVIEDPAIGDRDPLKVGALVMLANVEANAGNLEAARAAYDRTGLTAQQCALIDGGPVLLRTGASSADFPMEAMRWGFEGWTQTEFDIAADGRTTNVRTVMAYPPAVFAKASRGILDDARFRASYRPGNDLGCGGATRRIRFSMP